MRPLVDTVERKLGRIARSSHGVVTRPELLRAGLTLDEIRGRLRSGALLREYRGVYRVGHDAPGVEARYLAAVRACGERAVLSGPAAAYLFGAIKGPAPRPEVTAPTLRRVPGVRTRRSRAVEATTFGAIPVTTLPRTLIDLAAALDLDDLARAFHEAGVRYGITPARYRTSSRGGRRVPAQPSSAQSLGGDAPVVLSRLEKRFLALLREAGLPLPKTNRQAGSKYVDCRWPDHALTVELDSYRYHHSRHAWEQDRRREREARARGDDCRRFTWGDVFEHPAQMLAELGALLDSRPSAPSRLGRLPAETSQGGSRASGLR